MLRRLHNLGPVSHEDLLVGIDTADDAGVFRLSDDVALVQTVDFFTPIVDDPHDWGRIAAANALSDVYAMGGRPLTALQMVGWPREELPIEMLGDVLEGGAEILSEAGCVLVGGHSIDDPEPKFGMAVTGLIHPNEIITNSGGVAGDVLVLTKPLGSGIAATAIKRELASQRLVIEVVELMTALNAGAAQAMRRIGVRAATDVTGYGLLGHLGELMRASGLSAEINWDSVPFLDGIAELAADNVVPGGTLRNLRAASKFTSFDGIDRVGQTMLADAQTSGGLLVAVDAPLEKAFHQALSEEGVDGWTIGRLRERTFGEGPTGLIAVRRDGAR